MIFDLILIIFFQPLVSSIFLFLAPILNYFFKEKNKELIFSLFFFSFLTDIFFLKPLGFFLFLTSTCLLLIIGLEKILSYHYFYQKLVYFFVFNLCFLILFFYFSFRTIFDFVFFLKFLVLNLLFQIIYFLIKSLFR